MLNGLHRRARRRSSPIRSALKPADTATAAKLQTAIDAIDAFVATLTSSPQSFEDFIQKPGQLREDVMGLMNDEPLAQASLALYARLERNYAARAAAYNAWLASLAGINSTLKAAGEKPVAAPHR